MRLQAGRRARALRESLGTAGLIVAVVALVAALVGTAIAAGGLTAQQEKQVKKIAKKYAGKDGAAGPQGPAGAQGAPGANGSSGTVGATGPKGPTGAAGVTGPGGTTGPTGSPWTVGGTLPEGASETGIWSLGPFENVATYPGEFTNVPVALSFPIPLAAEMAFSQAHLILKNGKEFTTGGEVTSTECTGTVKAPKAKPGNLCVYLATTATPESGAKALINPESAFQNSTGEEKIGITGITLQVFTLNQNGVLAAGTWAVTAEE